MVGGRLTRSIPRLTAPWRNQVITATLLTLEILYEESEAKMGYNLLGQLVWTIKNTEGHEKPKELENHLDGNTGWGL